MNLSNLVQSRNVVIMIKIGVVGFSRPQFDMKAAKLILLELIELLADGHDPKSIELVSGLTNMGVPKLAYEIAVEKGYITVGISAQRALTVKSGIFPCDKQIIEGQEFGDESLVFINYIDYLIRVGGGKQSHKEVEMFKVKITNREYAEESYLIEKEVEWYGK